MHIKEKTMSAMQGHSRESDLRQVNTGNSYATLRFKNCDNFKLWPGSAIKTSRRKQPKDVRKCKSDTARDRPKIFKMCTFVTDIHTGKSKSPDGRQATAHIQQCSRQINNTKMEGERDMM